MLATIREFIAAIQEFIAAKRNELFWTSYLVLGAVVAVLGALGGLIFGYALDLPQVEQLRANRPNIVSYVYSDDGRVLGQFALEKRILVTYDEIPTDLKDAILAIEDRDFFRHTGIDFRRLFVTILRDIFLGERKGASTLTMQLSKLRFTSPVREGLAGIERKIKDMLFALEIEKNYTKEQIFTFYFNQMNLGHGRYGVASSADFYLNKSLAELTLAESALLAGMIQIPGHYCPIDNPENALKRRNLVLSRMYDVGFIDRDALVKAMNEPIDIPVTDQELSPAPYFVEWVRQYLEKRYTTDQIWEGGLRIYTTLDYDMQIAAQTALREGLRDFDQEVNSWEGPIQNILQQGKSLEDFYDPQWRRVFYEGQMLPGLVLESNPKEAIVKIGSYTTVLTLEDIEWTGHKRVDRALKPGDVATFSAVNIDRVQRTMKAELDRVPEVQGAILALDNRTGAVRAMVGGFDFALSKFNRATQALRQPGSLFKPFTYVTAMDSGYTPLDLLLDAPVNFRDALGRVYAPVNSDGEFRGLIPVHEAFAMSRNVPTIRLANALGIEKVIETAHRFGINRDLPPYLPIALGAGELTLEEITSAFSVFPNNGVRAYPFFIKRVTDYNGVVLEEHQNTFDQAISPETAAKMTYLLRRVVEAGTAWRARSLECPVGGKTGTTNEATDSWFVGFTPEVTAGVWTGYDEKKSLGAKVFGATLALPIWIEFMQGVCEKQPGGRFENIYSPTGVNLVQARPVTPDQPEEPAGGSSTPWTVEDIPAPPQQ